MASGHVSDEVADQVEKFLKGCRNVDENFLRSFLEPYTVTAIGEKYLSLMKEISFQMK
jgi:hypothetical protein